MTVDTSQDTATTESPVAPALTPSAGTLLRGYREALGIRPEALAAKLHVPLSKLHALEQDRLDALPDAMFARALALAVCRQLNTDAAPVLARLPTQDVSRLATHDERGLDFPLKRPSLLPASGLRALRDLPRWQLGLALLLIALFVFKPWGETTGGTPQSADPVHVRNVSQVVVPLNPPAGSLEPAAATVAEPAPFQGSAMVVTPLQTNSVVLTPVLPAAAAEGASK